MAESIESIESAGGLRAAGTASGLTEDEMVTVRDQLAARGPLSDYLRGARYRWLRFKRDGGSGDLSADRFEATVYDYTNLRLLEVAGLLDDLGSVAVTPSARQPIPTTEELDEAAGIVERVHPLGAALRAGLVRAYQPMPPLAPVGLPDGRSRRVVAVGLYAPGAGGMDALGGARHHLLGVDLTTQQVHEAHDLDDLPVLDEEREEDCAAPVGSDQCGSHQGLTGQLELVIEGPAPVREELWRLVVVRPTESSGTNGSGVELRHVRYRGRDVLRRAHVPILNVEYQGPTPACGPTFRDWLDEEACFKVLAGHDPLPGFRLSPRPPETIIEAGEDGGNFRGVAIHFDGDDLVLTSEMKAGWYRYVTAWRLRADGTIEPRMGISAVKNFCTCQLHIHHAYFRLDWAVDGSQDNFAEEFNEGGLLGVGDGWQRLAFETERRQSPGTQRSWRVGNAGTGATCTLMPGRDDGTADLYGAGDTWWLRFHENEIDDGQGFTSNRVLSRARIDLFADGEPIDGEDIVSWYGVHFEHDHFADPRAGAYFGPVLTSSWAAPAGGRSRLTTA